MTDNLKAPRRREGMKYDADHDCEQCGMSAPRSTLCEGCEVAERLTAQYEREVAQLDGLRHVIAALEGRLAALGDLDGWEDAAHHWWERMREAERERDGWRRRFGDGIDHNEHNALALLDLYEQRTEAAEKVRDELLQSLGEFAALAARIAKADAKHPRDAYDGVWASVNTLENNLRMAREDLRREPTWAHALLCEMREVFVEIARGNTERLADELLDVATVAMRWRRAALERGSR